MAAPSFMLFVSAVLLAVIQSTSARSDAADEYYYNYLFKDGPQNYEDKQVRNLDGIELQGINYYTNRGHNLQKPKINLVELAQLVYASNYRNNEIYGNFPGQILVKSPQKKKRHADTQDNYYREKRQIDIIDGDDILLNKENTKKPKRNADSEHNYNREKRQLDPIGGGNLLNKENTEKPKRHAVSEHNYNREKRQVDDLDARDLSTPTTQATISTPEVYDNGPSKIEPAPSDETIFDKFLEAVANHPVLSSDIS